MSTFIAEIRVDVRTEISRVNRLRLLILARNYLIVALRNLKYTVAVALVLMALSARVEAHNDEWALAVPLEEISIDGDLGDWPRGMLKYPIVRVGGGEQPRDSSDFQGTFRVGYSASERALYVAVEVQDESLVVDDSVQANWLNQDGCDVYVDVAHGERDGTVVQYVLWGQERARYGAQGKLDQWQDAEVSARRDGGTQVYEWRIDLGAMGPDLTLRPGRVLGFDLALMDRDRDDSYSWMHWGPGTGKVRSPRALGDLLLAGPGEVMGSVRGRVAWNDGAERPPPRAVQVHSVDGRSLWKIRTDGNGSYAMDMPAATYRITLVDFRLGTNDRIEVEVSVTGGEELEIDPLVATYVPPSERYRRMRRSPVDGKQRGISLEAATHPVTEATFQPLLESNVTWIVQTPFGWQSRYNSPRIRLSPNAGWWGESDMGIAETTQMAREFGIHTLLKPHVWLSDRSDGKWRAQIEMDSEADWQQWFAEYRSFMLHYARLAEENDIEALCIGTELHRAAVVRPADWRELIAAVRQEYSGELTYAANWYSEYQEISFWDALDYIGIQAYFPLTEQVAPSVEELKRGWGPHLAAIEAVQRAQQKPVLFTEVGYHSTVDGAIRPWEWDSEDAEGTQELGLQTQANCYEALFQIFWSREWFAGAYFWKWHADDDAAGGPNYATEFTPQNKPAEQVMAKWYAR